MLVGETDDGLFRVLDLLPSSVPLLLQYGNFGDLYHCHQHFRQAVIRRSRKHRIMILPKSIHFEDEENAAAIVAAIAAQPDVTPMVRDRPSQLFARASRHLRGGASTQVCACFRGGRMVLTDRLHAHILSLLLGKPRIVLDNSYGKIAKFADMWTRDAAFASAAILSEARAMLRAARMTGDPLD